MEKKFIKVFESAMSRYTRGGFLVGDYVEFVKNYKTHEEFKELSDHYKETIEDLVKSNLRLRIVGVDDYYPVRFPGNPDSTNGKVTVKISADQGGGRYLYSVLVPPCLIKVIDFYPNLAPLPDQFNYNNNEIHQPKEADAVEGGIKGGDYSLPTSNKKVKGSKKKGESYTTNYLSGLKA